MLAFFLVLNISLNVFPNCSFGLSRERERFYETSSVPQILPTYAQCTKANFSKKAKLKLKLCQLKKIGFSLKEKMIEEQSNVHWIRQYESPPLPPPMDGRFTSFIRHKCFMSPQAKPGKITNLSAQTKITKTANILRGI